MRLCDCVCMEVPKDVFGMARYQKCDLQVSFVPTQNMIVVFIRCSLK